MPIKLRTEEQMLEALEENNNERLVDIRRTRLVQERLEFGKYEITPPIDLISNLTKVNKKYGPKTERVVYIMKWYGKGLRRTEYLTLYKIGEAGSAGVRASQIRKKYGGEIEVLQYIRTDQARYIEHVLHYIFGHRRVLYPTYEFFDLDEDDLLWLRKIRNINAEMFCISIGEDHLRRIY